MSTPLDWNAIQWFSDNVATYRPGLVDGFAVLEPLESFGDFRQPRTGRFWQFDGTLSQIESDDFDITAAGTIALWVNVTNFTGNQTFIESTTSAGNDWVIWQTSGEVRVNVRVGSVNHNVSGVGALVNGQRELIVLTFDGVTAKLYVNNVEFTDPPNAVTSVATAGTMNFGLRQDDAFPCRCGISDVRMFSRVLTSAELDYLWDGSGTDPGTPDRWFHGNEENGLTVFSSSGDGVTGTIVNATLPNFHATDSAIPNPANQVGYTNNAGVIIPRNEAIPAEDVQGNPLEFSGNSPLPASINAPIFTADGTDDHILLPHLTGSETVTSFVGTSTPSISAGRIDFTIGTCGQLLLSDGTYLPLQERSGTTAYNVDGTGRHGTITGATTATDTGAWAARSSEVEDWCILHGGRMEGDVFVEGLLDDSAAANGSPITLAKGHFGNPRSVLVFDPWAAPELSAINYPADSPPGQLLRNLAPDQTKFRSEQNPAPLDFGTFDNTNPDSVLLGTPFVESGEFTWSMWFRPNKVTGNIVADSNTSGGPGLGRMQYVNTSLMNFVDDAGTLQNYSFAAGSLPEDIWHLAIYTRDNGGLVRCYVDDVESSSGAVAFGTTTLHQFGKRFASSNPFGGEIGEVQRFAAPLSAGDRTALFNRQTPAASPTNRWDYSDQAGTTLTDQVAGNNGAVDANASTFWGSTYIDGSPFADGDNKLFTVPAPLTGDDLAAAIDYIQRIEAPAFLPAWAVNSNPRVHSLVQ